MSQPTTDTAQSTSDKTDATESTTLALGGMTCANCARTIEKALRETPGVVSAAVNFATEQALVVHDPGLAPPTQLAAAVADAGYRAEPVTPDGDGDPDRDRSAEAVAAARKTLLVSWSIMLPMMAVMIAYMGFGVPVPHHGWVMVAMALAVLVLSGRATFASGWNSIRRGAANMDALIALGAAAAFVTGPLAALDFPIGNYAGVSAMILAFHHVGRYIETLARGRASKAIRELMELGAKSARVLRDGVEVDVPIRQVRKGDILVVRPGEKIPADGVVIEGRSAVDESMVSGESIPADRKAGDEVIGATINQEGVLKVRTTRVGKDTFLSQIVELVREAQGTKVPIQAFADRVTTYFVPGVIGLSVLTFAGWLLFHAQLQGVAVWAGTWLPWVDPELGRLTLAVFASVAVMVIACPCSLGLATPTALMVSSGVGARHGILIRSGDAIELMKDVRTIVFDKTGTLTVGKPTLTDVVPLEGADRQAVLLYAGSLEDNSEHPLARAVVDQARKEDIDLRPSHDFRSITGRGITGTVDGKRVVIGTRELMEAEQIDTTAADAAVTELEAGAKSTMLLAVDGRMLGVLGLADTLKPGSRAAVTALKSMGFEVVMISGDNERTARAIGELAGIDHVLAGVMPDRKAEEIRRLQDRSGWVAMVGDGINDAPALAQANVGIALGTGTDVAIESSDITLVRGELQAVVSAIRLSRATFRKIKQNLFWAFFYNAVAVPTAMLGLLHPVMAPIAMALSSITVVLNSILLQRVNLTGE